MAQAPMVNIHDAKTRLSKLIESVESGQAEYIVIARAGRPVARLVGLQKAAIRLGLAEGSFTIAPPDQALDSEIAASFDIGSVIPG